MELCRYRSECTDKRAHFGGQRILDGGACALAADRLPFDGCVSRLRTATVRSGTSRKNIFEKYIKSENIVPDRTAQTRFTGLNLASRRPCEPMATFRLWGIAEKFVGLLPNHIGRRNRSKRGYILTAPSICSSISNTLGRSVSLSTIGIQAIVSQSSLPTIGEAASEIGT